MNAADQLVKGLGDVRRVTDAFRDALGEGEERKDVEEIQARKAWNWRPVALALGGVVVAVVLLRVLTKR